MNYLYFSEHELACKCSYPDCPKNKMDKGFMLKLIAFRDHLDMPLTLSSAYRCPKHNTDTSDTGSDGPHAQGKAVDILCSSDKARIILTTALNFGFFGVGISQKGPMQSRFIHVDMVPGRTGRLWSY